MRTKVDLVLLFLALSLGSVLCQNARAPGSRPLPQWLTGIIAVVGFLFLTFVVFIINRLWCEKPKRKLTDPENESRNDYENVGDRNKNLRRDSDEMRTYTNLGMDRSEEKVTAM